MDPGVLFFVGALAVFALLVGLPMYFARRRRQGLAEENARNETLYVSMFPELQPLYHPERLVAFVEARLARRSTSPAARKAWGWDNPPGFDGYRAEFTRTDKGEAARLVDTARKPRGQFLWEDRPEGGVLRVGQGKLTVDLANRQDPRVRYWHPEREFKWSRKGWVFKTPVADAPFESSSSSPGLVSSDYSSSSSSSREGAFAGQGGTFDGGGASAGWDEPSGAAASGDPAGASADSSSGGAGSTAY
jgi:uncharacterized membrane protein YgcG